MSDQDSRSAELTERIAKLEEQTQDLQRQVGALLKRHKRKKRVGKPTDLRDALSSDVMLKTLSVLLLVSLLPIFGPMTLGLFLPTSMSSEIPYPPWEVLDLLPGGKSIWMPFWQISIFLTFVVGVLAFVSSRD